MPGFLVLDECRLLAPSVTAGAPLPRPPGARDIARRPSPRLSVEAKSPTGAAGIASSRGVLTTSFLTQTAVADVFVQWTFENAQFSDGGALTGSMPSRRWRRSARRSAESFHMS